MKKLLAILFTICFILTNLPFASAQEEILCDFGTLSGSEIGVGAVYAGPVYDMDKYGFATFTIDFEETGSYDIYLKCRTQHAVLDIMQDYRTVSTKEIIRDHATHEIAWANPQEEKIGTVNVYKKGESLIGFDVVSVDVTIGVDSMRLVRTGDAPNKLSWYATDTADYPQEAAYNRWCGGYGMYSPLAIGFPINFEESGNYEIYASLGARDATLDINVDGELALTKQVTSDHDTDENSWLNPQEYLLGSINIYEAGEHTIKFVVKEAHNSILFRQFELVRTGEPAQPTEPPILPQKIEFEDYNPGGQNVGYYDNSEGVVPVWCINRGDDVEYGKGGSGYIVSFGVGEWLKYDVNAKKAGRYQVLVSYAMTDQKDVTVSVETDGVSPCSKVLYPTGDWSTYVEESLGVINLTEGVNTLKFAMVLREMNVDYFILNPIADAPMVETVSMNDTDVLETQTAPSGADSIILTFTEEINAEETSFELYEGNTYIPTICSVEGNVVTLSLKQSLLPGTSYELRLTNIVSALDGTAFEDAKVEFVTDEFTTHSGSITDVSATLIDENSIKITGVAKSSQNIGIKGRALTLYLDSQAVLNTVSGEDGAFSFVYEIPQDVISKKYEFKISSGNTEENVSILYVSDQMKKEIAGIFSNAKTKEDVKTALENYADELILDYATDITKVKTADEFHAYFAGKEYKTEDDVISVYNIALALGMIKAADDTQDINTVLSQDRFVLPLDVEENYYLDDRTVMINEIFDAKNDSFEELYIVVKDAVRKAYLLQLGKEDSLTVSKNCEFENDEMIVIDISYETSIKDATKATFFYTCEDLESFEDISVETNEGVVAEVTQNGNELKIEFAFAGEIKDFGKLKFSVDTGNYVLTEKSEIVYRKQGYPLDAIGCSKDKEIEVTVKSARKQSSGGGNGGGGGAISSSGKGYNTSGSHIAQSSDTEQQTDTKPKEFKDLKDAMWAESYVVSLYNKGIISMADDGNFRPNDYVTREEFLKMLVMSFELFDENAEVSFTDVERGSWYYPYVASGYASGIILGNDENRFETGKQITREDMSVMISRILSALGYQAGNVEAFEDSDEISSYAKDAVSLVKYLEIVNGMGDKTFAPKAKTTRAQAAKVIYKAMEVVGR